MSAFDDRERAFEAKFARDQDALFRITARRNRLVGEWAAERMGLTPEETDAYAKAVVMGMREDDLKAMIEAAFPDAVVSITDLAGDNDHYAAHVVSESFRGLTRVAQHKAVYAALGGRMGGELHALQLSTGVPS